MNEINKQVNLRKAANRYMEYMKRFNAENSELDKNGNVIYWRDLPLPLPLPFAYFLDNLD